MYSHCVHCLWMYACACILCVSHHFSGRHHECRRLSRLRNSVWRHKKETPTEQYVYNPSIISTVFIGILRHTNTVFWVYNRLWMCNVCGGGCRCGCSRLHFIYLFMVNNFGKSISQLARWLLIIVFDIFWFHFMQ